MRVICLFALLLLAACGDLPAEVARLVPALPFVEQPTSPLTETAVGTLYTVIGPNPANARIEPVTIGPIFARLEPGKTVTVVATIMGQTVSGSNQWHVIELDGRRLYIHSSLLQP